MNARVVLDDFVDEFGWTTEVQLQLALDFIGRFSDLVDWNTYLEIVAEREREGREV